MATNKLSSYWRAFVIHFKRFIKSIFDDRVSVKSRTLAIFAVICLGFAGLVFQLINLQIFDSSDKYAAQVDQLVDEVELTAERGNIYDRNMNLLVQDSSAKSINLIPKSVEDPVTVSHVLASDLNLEYDDVYKIATKLEDDKVEVSNSTYNFDEEKLLNVLGNDEAYSVKNSSFYVIPEKVKDADGDAKTIAQFLERDPEDIKEYLTSKENTTQLVKSKVDNEEAEAIQEKFTTYDEDGDKDTGGVELLDDKKRYYTNGNFASYVLGFTGSDHVGLYGVEKTFDNELTGTKAKVYYQKDAQGNVITSQTKIVQEAKKGEDLVLSLDSNIQSVAEKALSGAVNEWHAKSGTAIVMNSKTGEVLAMASKPDYNLNDPYALSESFVSTHQSELAGLTEAEQREQMWKNPAVSFIYEPGSTFKPITVSSALEEGKVNPGTKLNCTGSYNVQGTTIHCTGVHGEQTISQALENSCNPALVQIIQNVDPNVFYKYVYNYGFGEPTDIELTGEESGIVNRVFDSEGNIKIVDYSTFSFGQGLATTPIQLITGLNALINHGYYVKPTIVKDGGEESPRQIVSSATSETLRQEMQAVVDSKPYLAALKGNFTLGGKTGTAEKFVDGHYIEGVNVTSFFCFAPVDDPEYCCLLVLDEPDPNAAGATSAAPAAMEILKQTLIYGGSNPDENTQAPVLVPDCVGQTVSEVESVLDERGITYRVEKAGEGETVVAQSLPAQSQYQEGNELVLTVNQKQDEEIKTVPDFTGKSVQSVNSEVQKLGMRLKVQGSGFAAAQSIAPGTEVVPQSEITVRFEE